MVRLVKASRGERVLLTTDVLLALDGTDQPEELLYVITAPPTHGQVEYIRHPGLPIDSFSQLDVVANLVCYVHDNRATATKEWVRWVQEPYSALQKPPSALQEPHSALQEPYSALPEPYSALQEPYSASQEPYSASQEPYSALQEPHSTLQEP